MARARRLIVIGIDGGMLALAEQFMQAGKMPNLARLAARGVLTEALPSIPVDTPTNWTTIMTGAEPSTHGVYSFTSHTAGEPFERGPLNPGRNKSSSFSKAAFFWNTLEAAGYRCAVVNYPTGWPSTLTRGVVVGGVTPGGEPWRLAKPAVYAAGTPRATPTALPSIKFVPRTLAIRDAQGWTGAMSSRSPLLEAQVNVGSDGGRMPLFFLLVDSEGRGYDRAVVAPSRDIAAPLAVLAPGEWSPWLEQRFGGEPGIFRIKLAHLSPDARDVEVYITDVFKTRGWTSPPDLEQGIIERAGPYIEGFECPYVPFDLEARPYGPVNVSPGFMLEHARMQADWMVALAGHLRAVSGWDALILHYHYLDALNHTYLGYLYDRLPFSTPKMTADTWDLYAESYQVVDRLISGLVDAHADGETLVVVTSDHAALPCWKYVAISHILMRAGLLAYEWDERSGKSHVDLSRSRAVPYLDPQHIWINLAGREPDGIVPPEEYEATREAVIDALRAVRDPETGMPPIRLAARREDMGIFGRAQERAGDVVFFLQPGYTTWDGTLESLRFHEISPDRLTAPLVAPSLEVVGHHTPYLPTARIGMFQNSALTLFSGPGVRPALRRRYPIRLIDVAPTIAHILGVPAPPDSDGRVVTDILGAG